MKTIKIGTHTIEHYDSIEDMPTERFYAYNRMLLIDSGIGGDMVSIDDHITKVMKYVELGNRANAMQQLGNMRNSFYFVTQGINPKHLSFAALVHKIDGQIVYDFSEENLRELVKKFSKWGASKSFYDKVIDLVKKKIESELELYLPNNFNDSDTKEIYGSVKKKAKLILDEIIKGVDRTKEIDDIDSFIFDFAKPREYTGEKGVEAAYVNNFEDMCITVSKYTGRDAKKLPVLSFYRTLEMIKKENKPKRGKKGAKIS